MPSASHCGLNAAVGGGSSVVGRAAATSGGYGVVTAQPETKARPQAAARPPHTPAPSSPQ